MPQAGKAPYPPRTAGTTSCPSASIDPTATSRGIPVDPGTT